MNHGNIRLLRGWGLFGLVYLSGVLVSSAVNATIVGHFFNGTEQCRTLKLWMGLADETGDPVPPSDGTVLINIGELTGDWTQELATYTGLTTAYFFWLEGPEGGTCNHPHTWTSAARTPPQENTTIHLYLDLTGGQGGGTNYPLCVSVTVRNNQVYPVLLNVTEYGSYWLPAGAITTFSWQQDSASTKSVRYSQEGIPAWAGAALWTSSNWGGCSTGGVTASVSTGWVPTIGGGLGDTNGPGSSLGTNFFGDNGPLTNGSASDLYRESTGRRIGDLLHQDIQVGLTAVGQEIRDQGTQIGVKLDGIKTGMDGANSYLADLVSKAGDLLVITSKFDVITSLNQSNFLENVKQCNYLVSIVSGASNLVTQTTANGDTLSGILSNAVSQTDQINQRLGGSLDVITNQLAVIVSEYDPEQTNNPADYSPILRTVTNATDILNETLSQINTNLLDFRNQNTNLLGQIKDVLAGQTNAFLWPSNSLDIIASMLSTITNTSQSGISASNAAYGRMLDDLSSATSVATSLSNSLVNLAGGIGIPATAFGDPGDFLRIRFTINGTAHVVSMHPDDRPGIKALMHAFKTLLSVILTLCYVWFLLETCVGPQAMVGLMASTEQMKVPNISVFGNNFGWSFWAIYLVIFGQIIAALPALLFAWMPSGALDMLKENPLNSFGSEHQALAISVWFLYQMFPVAEFFMYLVNGITVWLLRAGSMWFWRTLTRAMPG